MTGTTYARRSARVILLDARERVLLFWFENRLWVTPGGGVRDGEPLAVAAARELLEETGFEVLASELRHIAHSEGYADLGFAKGTFRDDYFVLRIDAHEVDTSGIEEYEVPQLGEARWWSVDELRATTDRVVPAPLADIIIEVLEDRVPSMPRVIPWHL